MAFTCGECFSLKADHSKGHVNQILGPGISHKLNHLKDLFKMKILLVSYNIQAFIKVIRLFAIKCRSHIPRSIDGSAIRF